MTLGTLTNPTLSLGLMGVNDYATSMPFIDIMKMAREWSADNGVDYADLVSGGYLDANGWPNAIPPGCTYVNLIWDWTSTDAAALASRAGNYILTYEGTGTITLTGVTTNSSSAGRIEFTNPTGDSSLGLLITATNAAPNHVKNIVIVHERNEALHALGEKFNPDFLATIEDVREIRFMGWQQINFSEQVDWADRPLLTDYTWATAALGVPLEVMVELANKIGADPWFCTPHKATDAYATAMATYVKANLNADLVARVEYSNEKWNSAFGVRTWAATESTTAWGSMQFIDWIVKRAVETAVCWNTVYGGEAATRLLHVLGAQNVDAATTDYELDAPVWEAEEPGDYVDPNTIFGAIGINTYFGGEYVSDETRRDALIAYIGGHTTQQSYDWLAAKAMDPAVPYSIPDVVGDWTAQKAVATARSKVMIAYEGGQHEHHSAFVGVPAEDQAVLLPFLSGYCRSDQMGVLYGELWDEWQAIGGGPFVNSGEVSAAAVSGSWGILSALGDTQPRATVAFTRNALQDDWFGDGGGTRYLPQTVAALSGGGSHRVVMSVRGGTVTGDESGHNAVVLPGVLSDYTIEHEADSDLYVFTDGDVVFKVYACQAVAFSG